MTGGVLPLLVGAALAASPAPPSDELWVALPTPAERARAHDAGFGWAEGQDGDWYRLTGTPAMADAAGLDWRRVAVSADGWRPDPDEVADRLGALVEAPGGRTDVALVQLGESERGEPILALRIGEGARAVRILGGHHGDEGSSVEVALALAEALAGGAPLPPDTEVWIVPAVNPDGLRAGTRYNALGVDLNRNYGWEWSATESGAGAAPFSEPETRAIRALARARSFDAGLSLHSGAQNLGWVWNWTADERAVEEPLFAAIAEGYAAACTAPDFWLTNGADWYLTRGDTTDWSYGAWGAYDFTLELTEDKSPPLADVPTYTAWHLDAIRAWLARPPDRVATLVDDTTGEPLPASISGPDIADAWALGAIARWADPAGAPWTVTAPGYAPALLPADASLELRLVPTALLAALPSPRLLSRGAGPTVVTLAGVGAVPLTLVQPGERAVTLPADAPGTWTVDPSALASGAWTLVTDAGVVPRGLFVGEVDDRVALAGATLADGVLTLTGGGFAPGAEAWSIGGPARAAHRLARLDEAADTASFALPSADDDVLLWTNGAWLAAVGVQSAAQVDPSPPPWTSRLPAEAPVDPTITAAGACGSSAAWALLLLPILTLRGARAACGLPSGRAGGRRDGPPSARGCS